MRVLAVGCVAAVVFAVAPDAAAGQRAGDAYIDAGARELVRLGRERRNTVDRSIDRYEAVVQERLSAGLRTIGRERLFYRRETAGRIDWRRGGPVRIEVLGAREVIPSVLRDAQIPADLRGFMPHLAFDPVDNDIFVRFDTTFLRHPLGSDAESHYRYRSGDTMTIRLPDGRSVRLVELVVIPRRDDIHLLSGSFWFDQDTHAVVRAVFRPARAFDFDRDADDDDDVPGFIKPIRAELLYITLEYGLWQLRWWMPRVMAAEGVFQISFLNMPLSYERRYSEYVVEGDTSRAAVAADSTAERPCRPPFSLEVRVGNEPDRADSARIERRRAREEAIQDTARRNRIERARRCLESFQVVVPADSAQLLASEYLPASAYSSDVELLTANELEELKRQLDRLPESPWQLRPPTFAWGLGSAGLLRYNRVEALSIGARTGLDLGRLQLEASARIGLADVEPNGEFAVSRETPGSLRRLAVYRRLAAANPETKPLGFGNSLNAVLFGRDDGQYFRTWGVELEASPARASTQGYDLRLYAERQSGAVTETDFSVRNLLDGDHGFRPNIAAADADQVGASLALRTSHGFDPEAFRWSGEVRVSGEAGTFRFARPAVTVRAALPAGRTAISLEAAAGTSFGELPLQSEWYLGGPASLRGYWGGIVHGDAFWRGRVELSRGVPAARLSLFADAGWAGKRTAFGTRDALASAGAGAAFLDGLVRFDLARALERPTGWRLDLFVSGSF